MSHELLYLCFLLLKYYFPINSTAITFITDTLKKSLIKPALVTSLSIMIKSQEVKRILSCTYISGPKEEWTLEIWTIEYLFIVLQKRILHDFLQNKLLCQICQCCLHCASYLLTHSAVMRQAPNSNDVFSGNLFSEGRLNFCLFLCFYLWDKISSPWNGKVAFPGQANRKNTWRQMQSTQDTLQKHA